MKTQELKIYNKLIEEKGFTYAITRIASPGKSEHQTGLAFDLNDSKTSVRDSFEFTDAYKWLKEYFSRKI